MNFFYILSIISLFVTIQCLCDPSKFMYANNEIVDAASFNDNGILKLRTDVTIDPVACSGNASFEWTLVLSKTQNITLTPESTKVVNGTTKSFVVLTEKSYDFEYPFTVFCKISIGENYVGQTEQKVIKKNVETCNLKFDYVLNGIENTTSLIVNRTLQNTIIINFSLVGNCSDVKDQFHIQWTVMDPEYFRYNFGVDYTRNISSLKFTVYENVTLPSKSLILATFNIGSMTHSEKFILKAPSNIAIRSPNTKIVTAGDNIVVCAKSVYCKGIYFRSNVPRYSVISNVSTNFMDNVCVQSIVPADNYTSLNYSAYCNNSNEILSDSIKFIVAEPPKPIALTSNATSGIAYNSTFALKVTNPSNLTYYYSWTLLECGNPNRTNFLRITNGTSLVTALPGCQIAGQGGNSIQIVQVTAFTATGSVTAKIGINITNPIYTKDQIEKIVEQAKNRIKTMNTTNITDSSEKISDFIDKAYIKANETGVFNKTEMAIEVKEAVAKLKEVATNIKDSKDSIAYIDTIQSFGNITISPNESYALLNSMINATAHSNIDNLQKIVKTAVQLKTNTLNATNVENINMTKTLISVLKNVAYSRLTSLSFNETGNFTENGIIMKVTPLKVEGVAQKMEIKTGNVTVPSSLVQNLNGSSVGVKVAELTKEFASSFNRSFMVDISIFADNKTLAIKNLLEPIQLNITGKGVCQYYNETNKQWQTDGVTKLREEGNVTICLTTHLSTFSLDTELPQVAGMNPIYLAFVIVPILGIVIWLILRSPKKDDRVSIDEKFNYQFLGANQV
eukprot:TRINITY_DN3226_c6_g18_i1.p1 TRINITY_DN3226_c6_g18~~TRINITY_DN3226_c6_g18_i1.p1  ORF type:complete len:791 (-),score=202.15 TRINITY_DN3226_c6_g18_i1:83-2455(-)